MLDNVNWELLSILSGTLFGSLLVLKPAIYRVTKSFKFSLEIQKLSVFFMALLLGVIMAAMSGERVSIIEGTKLNSLYPFIGTVATGFAIALGIKGLHFVETFAGVLIEVLQRFNVPTPKE